MQNDKFFFGLGCLLWQLEKCENGNIDAIISKARNAKLSWLAFNVVQTDANGNYWCFDYNTDFVKRIHDAGMKCYAWGYHRGDTYGRFDDEIRLAKMAMNIGDGYIIDAEVEFNTKGDWADKMATMLRGEIVHQQTTNNKRPLLALTTYGDPVTQSDFPYREFLRNCDVFMPQTYYNAWGGSSNGNAIGLINQFAYSQWLQLTKDLGGDMRPIIPMLPLYQEYGYNVTGAINTDVMTYLKGYGGLTFWSWQHASQELWDSIANFNDLPFVGSDYPQPTTQPVQSPVAVSQPVQATQPPVQVQTVQTTTGDPLQEQLDALETKLEDETASLAKDELQLTQLEKQNEDLITANEKLVDENISLKEQLAQASKPTYADNTWIGNMEVKDALALVWGFVKYLFSKKN